jgi:hypothetical protein
VLPRTTRCWGNTYVIALVSESAKRELVEVVENALTYYSYLGEPGRAQLLKQVLPLLAAAALQEEREAHGHQRHLDDH